jgi:FkbM family methyltransferase
VKFEDGWWFPKGESHLQQWMANARVRMVLNGRAAYQGQKQQAVFELCRSFRTAVDVGGHVGLWSFNMAHRFGRVHAFEPVAAHRRCFLKNVPLTEVDPPDADLPTPPVAIVTLHAYALGATEGSVAIRTEQTSSGDSRVDGDGDIPMRTLDSFDLEDVDLVKIDCEGYELFVLQGAEATLAKYKPVVIVEQKPGHAQKYGLGERDALPFLKALGYRVEREMAGDFICVPT